MKPKTALLLVVLAIIVGVGGWWLGGAGGPSEQQLGNGQPAFPGLVGKLQDAATVSILQGGKTITLHRQGDVWGIEQKSGYPAKPDKLHALLAGLTDLRLLEPRTSEPGEYAALGVGDPDKDKDALLIRVLDAKQAPIVQVIVGHQRTLSNPAGAGGAGAQDQVYVRVVGQARSWLAQGKIEASTDPATWMGEDLTDIKGDRMASISVKEGDAALAFGLKDGKLTLVQPAEHPPLDDTKVKDVSQAFEYLIFMDVAKASAQPGTLVGDSVFHTKDGLTLTAHVTKAADNKVWAHFSAQGADKAADEAKKLSGLFGGWAYQVGDWKLSAFVPTLDGLKAPPPKEAPKPALSAAPSAAPGPAPASGAPVAGGAAPAQAPVPETTH